MVVRSNGGQLDAGTNQEVDKRRLHLGLTRLEVIAANESLVLLGELDATRNEGVLGGTVDERSVLENASDSKDGAGRDLLVTGLDGLHQVVGGVVDAGDDVGVALCVGSPEHDDLVELVGRLEVSDVFAEMLNVLDAGLGAGNDIVCAIFLVGSNEVGVVDAGQRLDGSHLLLDERLQSGFKNLSTVHGGGEVHTTDVPTTNGKVIGMNHGQHVVERDVDLTASLRLRAQLDSGRHDDRAIVICSARTLTGVPGQTLTVGQNASGDGRAVVATETNQHETDLANLALGLEVVELLLGRRDILAIGHIDLSGTVSVLAGDVRVGVLDIGRLDGEELRLGRSGAVGGGANAAFEAVVTFCVRSHGVVVVNLWVVVGLLCVERVRC